ncbi:hypothetical protein Q5752_001298 [Cryptotrichosporon argae]
MLLSRALQRHNQKRQANKLACATAVADPALPAELWIVVCAHVYWSSDAARLCTLSRLARCSRQLYAIAAPHLHAALILDSRTVRHLSTRRRALGVVPLPRPVFGPGRRVTAALASVEHLVVPYEVPPLARLSSFGSRRGTPLFPHATRATVLLDSWVVEDARFPDKPTHFEHDDCGDLRGLVDGLADFLSRHTAVRDLCVWLRPPMRAGWHQDFALVSSHVWAMFERFLKQLTKFRPLDSLTVHNYLENDRLPNGNVEAYFIFSDPSYDPFGPGIPSSLDSLQRTGTAARPAQVTFECAVPLVAQHVQTASGAGTQDWHAWANEQTTVWRDDGAGGFGERPWPEFIKLHDAPVCVCCGHTTSYPVRE